MLLQATTGKENFQAGSAQVHVFFLPSNRFPGKEVHITQLAKGSNPSCPVSTVGPKNYVPACTGARPEMGGWFTTAYEVPEGAIFKVFAIRKNPQFRRQGNMIIQARSSAAFRRIRVSLSGNVHAPFSHVTIEGRFDILDLADAESQGVNINPMYRRFFLEGQARAQMFALEEMDTETAPREVIQERQVEATDGEAVVVATRERRRALQL